MHKEPAMPVKRPDTDRRARQSERLARVLRVLQLIQGRGRWNARTIAEELECSERTVFRDLQVLTVAGVPWYLDEEMRSYRVRADFRFPVLPLSDDEILDQATATVVSSAPGLAFGNGARSTTEKLAATAQPDTQKIITDATHLIAVLDLKLADHGKHRDVIRTIQWALLHRKQLLGQYRSPYQPRAVSLRIHPYRLCLVNQAWYLIGRSLEVPNPHTYRVARFKTLRMLDTAADIPEEFDLKQYFGDAWSVFRGEHSYEVELSFSKDASPVVTETIWHHTQKVHRNRDGSVTLTFRVEGLGEIVWWILGWAGRVKVVKPPELRGMVAKQLQAALQMNPLD